MKDIGEGRLWNMEYLIEYLPYLVISLMIIFGSAHGIKSLMKKEEHYWVPLLVSSGGLFLMILMLTER